MKTYRSKKTYLPYLLIFILTCLAVAAAWSVLTQPTPQAGEQGKIEGYVHINTETSENSNIESPSVPGESLPEYSGAPYYVISDKPSLTAEEIERAKESYIDLTELDSLGRCGAAEASVGIEIMATTERGSIQHVKPSGWHTVRYDDLIEDKYLFNRCHLLGYQLTSILDDERNLITGTRYLNVSGMLPFENDIASYVRSTGYHVFYRVTPIFTGDNLVCDGVRMEAYSIEDDGELAFDVFCYNIQPGIIIDYETGDSYRE